MICAYCKRWQEADPRLITYKTDSNNNPFSERYCPKTNNRQKSDDKACPEIIIAKYFHCHYLQERVGVVLCLARQGKLKKKPKVIPPDCKNCYIQAAEIQELSRGRNLLLEHGFVKKQSGV